MGDETQAFRSPLRQARKNRKHQQYHSEEHPADAVLDLELRAADTQKHERDGNERARNQQNAQRQAQHGLGRRRLADHQIA
jgi:hypothetical protein